MEVCIDNVQSALNAEKGGASRLELCSALSEGGLTPTVGMLKIVKSVVSIPVFVMLRPRCGMDFVYSEDELKIMKEDAILLKDAGADGFVFGILKPDATVDDRSCKDLLNIIYPLQVTFHRAFDVVQNPVQSLTMLIALGFSRVLTSGQASSAVKGIPLIRELVKIAGNKIIIMPGVGILPYNVGYILSETGAKEVHGSCRIPVTSNVENDKFNKDCHMGSNDSNFNLQITDVDSVRQIVEYINKSS